MIRKWYQVPPSNLSIFLFDIFFCWFWWFVWLEFSVFLMRHVHVACGMTWILTVPWIFFSFFFIPSGMDMTWDTMDTSLLTTRSPPGPYHTLAGQECRETQGTITRPWGDCALWFSFRFELIWNGMTSHRCYEMAVEKIDQIWVPFWYHVFGKTGSAIIFFRAYAQSRIEDLILKLRTAGCSIVFLSGGFRCSGIVHDVVGHNGCGTYRFGGHQHLGTKTRESQLQSKILNAGYGWPPRIQFQNTT